MTANAQEREHAWFDELLPWYVNDTLGSAEREQVDVHLLNCVECRDNVAVLRLVQGAITRDTTIPLVTNSGVDGFLDAIDEQENRSARHWPIWAVAALLLLVAAGAILVNTLDTLFSVNPTQFQTATSAGAPQAMDYVLKVRFEAGTVEDDHIAIFEKIGAHSIAVQDDGSYQAVLQISAASMSDLRLRTSRIEGLEAVDSVQIVAIQLPVE